MALLVSGHEVDITMQNTAGKSCSLFFVDLFLWLVSSIGSVQQLAISCHETLVMCGRGHLFSSLPAIRIPWRCVYSPCQPSTPSALGLRPFNLLSRLLVFSRPTKNPGIFVMSMSAPTNGKSLPLSFPDSPYAIKPFPNHHHMLLQRSLQYSQFAFREGEMQTLQLRCAKNVVLSCFLLWISTCYGAPFSLSRRENF